MAKNVLVLKGSPRKNGNTEALAEAFIRGAKGKGHEVVVFDAAANAVQGCRACDACWSKGEACVFPDAFRDLAPLLAKADALVLATPLYWFGFSAQIKSALDKLYAFMSPAAAQKLRMTEAVLLMCAGDDRPEAFSGAVATFKEICAYLELREHGTITVTSVNDLGAIAGNPALSDAEKLGAAL